MCHLQSRFLHDEEYAIFESVQKKLQEAGLTPVTDQVLIDKIQQVRNSVDCIQEFDNFRPPDE